MTDSFSEESASNSKLEIFKEAGIYAFETFFNSKVSKCEAEQKIEDTKFVEFNITISAKEITSNLIIMLPLSTAAAIEYFMFSDTVPIKDDIDDRVLESVEALLNSTMQTFASRLNNIDSCALDDFDIIDKNIIEIDDIDTQNFIRLDIELNNKQLHILFKSDYFSSNTTPIDKKENYQLEEIEDDAGVNNINDIHNSRLDEEITNPSNLEEEIISPKNTVEEVLDNENNITEDSNSVSEPQIDINNSDTTSNTILEEDEIVTNVDNIEDENNNTEIEEDNIETTPPINNDTTIKEENMEDKQRWILLNSKNNNFYITEEPISLDEIKLKVSNVEFLSLICQEQHYLGSPNDLHQVLIV